MAIPREENRVTAGAGVDDSDGVTVIPFYIDSVTGKVLVAASLVTDAGGTVANAPAKRDENHVPSMFCTFSDDTGYGEPAVDNRNGRLYLDLLVT